MLTTEEIKRCIEEFNPEGFEVYNDGEEEYLQLPDGELLKFHTDYNELAYPLFLQRVIEGVNWNSELYEIHITRSTISHL